LRVAESAKRLVDLVGKCGSARLACVECRQHLIPPKSGLTSNQSNLI
jgi:hypothetical protein